DRADSLLRTSGVVEGTPLYGKVRRELDERVTLARSVAARAGDLGPLVEPLPAARVKALTRLASTGDQVLAGRLLAAPGGPPTGPATGVWRVGWSRRWPPRSTPATPGPWPPWLPTCACCPAWSARSAPWPSRARRPHRRPGKRRRRSPPAARSASS